jgi:hypothetical protein
MAATRPTRQRDSKSSLYEAAVEAVKSQEELLAARARLQLTPRRRRWRAFLVVTALVGAGLLAVRPEWLAGPKGIPPEPPGIAAASLRLTLLRERRRVQNFEQERGHLPLSLGEAGSPLNELGFELFPPDDYQLWGQAGDSVITLHSTDSVRTFLGESLRLLRQRGRP